MDNSNIRSTKKILNRRTFCENFDKIGQFIIAYFIYNTCGRGERGELARFSSTSSSAASTKLH